MNRIIRLAFAGTFLGLASTHATAGFPIQKFVVCPLTGNEFEIVGTPSCTHRGFNMALGANTSCDFATDLPQCPDSGLPLYRDFTQEELERLQDLVATESYAAARSRSRYYLAWFVEDHLQGKADLDRRFVLLLNGLALDPEHTFADAEYLDLVLTEAESGIPRLDDGSQPFYTALTAFIETHAGRHDRAETILDQLSRLPTAKDNETLATYIDAIQRCLADSYAETCDPRYAVIF